ncbi:pyridoxal-dependent decarboxylase [Rhodovulum sp. MB263]|uniref:pyridoxal phosphate-dependent decarboxylase family protein n=1 Tax=Rhodovulum sp. (strain MB263) TaxID=308754 RepID=UPI0012DB3534|nr:pyridoxal-dependent decarboxylase [Rhodovulum sp. MB263]
MLTNSNKIINRLEGNMLSRLLPDRDTPNIPNIFLPVESAGIENLDELFDSRHFSRHASQAVDQLAMHLRDGSIRGLALTDPAGIRAAATRLTRGGQTTDITEHDRKLAEIVELYLRTGIQVYSPGYMGRQFSGPFPVTAVVDMVSAIATQPASFYEAGALPCVVERVMGEELNSFLGFPSDRFTMFTTSGGSLANLTALLAARGRRYPQAWGEGLGGTDRRPAIAVSGDVHYSITRAAGILGIGENQLVRLPLDPARRITPTGAREALDAAAARGLDVFCIVANAGSTSFGAIDPLDELADIAAERGIWLHVDGSHGGSLIVSDRLRPRLAGLSRADSLTLDAHKTMFVPAACTLLFYRDRDQATAAFRQEASYVFEKTADVYSEYDSAERNFECTKRPMIMSLWVLWAMYGRAPIAEKLEVLCDMTRRAHGILADAPDFVPLHFPDTNILCFRYVPEEQLDPKALGALQTEIRARVRERGRFFISKVDIDGMPALRLVLMNHRITADHIRQMLDEVRTVALTIREEFPQPEEIRP